MITNERQYRVTKTQLDKLSRAIEGFDLTAAMSETGNRALAQAQLDALRSEYELLSSQVAEYEALKAGAFDSFEAENLDQLPELLIKARIARGLSQRELADRLGLKEQQVQRYEADYYKAASLERLCEVADALELTVHERAKIRSLDPRVGDQGREYTLPWQQFPVAEMYKRGWFGSFLGSLADAQENAEELVDGFLSNVWREPVQAFRRQQIRAKDTPNRYALMAWQCRVLALARDQKLKGKFRSKLIDNDWLRQLVRLSRLSDGPQRVQEYLHEVGIAMVIEPHLSQTYLDGAALVMQGHPPVIGLTLRYDRIDNFWFVLLHELGHLVRHAKLNRSEGFFDDLDSAAESIEREADEFAGEALIPNDRWEISIARYTRNSKAVKEFAEELQIDPAIIAGRIRREADNYIILGELVGSGQVRKQFQEVNFGQ